MSLRTPFWVSLVHRKMKGRSLFRDQVGPIHGVKNISPPPLSFSLLFFPFFSGAREEGRRGKCVIPRRRVCSCMFLIMSAGVSPNLHMLACFDYGCCMPAQLFRHAQGAGGGLLQAVGCLLAGLAGGNQSETWEGCMVSVTTATNFSLNCSKSTSLRKVVLKASNVLAASYLRR
jgi:hypothetical protein